MCLPFIFYPFAILFYLLEGFAIITSVGIYVDTCMLLGWAQALKVDPSDGKMLASRSRCWLQLGDGQKALEDATRCKRRCPEWAEVRLCRGQALMLLKVHFLLLFGDQSKHFYISFLFVWEQHFCILISTTAFIWAAVGLSSVSPFLPGLWESLRGAVGRRRAGPSERWDGQIVLVSREETPTVYSLLSSRWQKCTPYIGGLCNMHVLHQKHGCLVKLTDWLTALFREAMELKKKWCPPARRETEALPFFAFS